MEAADDFPIRQFPKNSETFRYFDWTIVYHKSHILKSVCTNDPKCTKGHPGTCELCLFENELELPHLPEMVFPKNKLVLTHKNGRCLEFSPLEALRGVQTGDTAIQVACAGMWQGARPDSNRLEKVKPYDWSFSTAYQGTLSDGMRTEETDVQLNIFKLMQKERILFFEDITLFEDELHDHGIAVCSVKIRVMASGFFILLTYFLRVDGVLIRMNGTRFHYENGNDYILREFTIKEAKFENIRHIPPAVYTIPSEVEKHLTVITKTTHKLFFD